MKTIHYITLISCIPLYYGCKNPKTETKEPAAQDTIPVKIIALKQQNQIPPVQTSGQFTTDDEAMLSFKTGGIIKSIFVKEGDPVKKGQLLASLNLTEINTQLTQSQLSLEKARRDYRRTSNLYKDSVATLEQLQNANTALQLAEQQHNLVAFNKKYSEIRAAKDGFILKKLADAGQQVAAGSAVFQTNGAGSENWLLKVGVSDREWSALNLNDHAEIESAAQPGTWREAVLSRKSESVDPETGTFTVYLKLKQYKAQSIAAGMFGKARIFPSKNAGSHGNWKIPYQALLDGDGDAGYVFITNDNKTARKVKVSIAGIEAQTVTINAGLENATSLIVSGSAYLNDNSPILPSTSKPAAL